MRVSNRFSNFSKRRKYNYAAVVFIIGGLSCFSDYDCVRSAIASPLSTESVRFEESNSWMEPDTQPLTVETPTEKNVDILEGALRSGPQVSETPALVDIQGNDLEPCPWAIEDTTLVMDEVTTQRANYTHTTCSGWRVERDGVNPFSYDDLQDVGWKHESSFPEEFEAAKIKVKRECKPTDNNDNKLYNAEEVLGDLYLSPEPPQTTDNDEGNQNNIYSPDYLFYFRGYERKERFFLAPLVRACFSNFASQGIDCIRCRKAPAGYVPPAAERPKTFDDLLLGP